MKKHLLGLDIGTTTVSWSVIESDTLKQVEASNVLNDSSIGNAVQNPDRIIEICLGIISDVRDRFQLVSIGLTGQMHGIILVDKGSNALSPLYTWQYPAEPDYCEKLTKRTGRKAYAGYGLVTLSSLDLPSETVCFCSVMDYLAMKLCGLTKPLIHSSVAASFGFFDLKKNEFDIRACRKAGIDTDLLPKVTSYSVSLGAYCGIPVFIPIGDNQASFMGVIDDDETALCVNCGTGSQVSAAVNSVHGHKCQEIRPYVDGKYLLTGSALCGGRAYAIVEKFFRLFAAEAGLEDKSFYKIMDSLALKTEDCSLKMDTRFCGTRDNPNFRGSVTGITEENFKPENFIRACIGGMTEELYGYYKDMNINGLTHIVGSGNGIRKSPVFMKMISDRFRMSLHISDVREEAAYGACLFAAKHTKFS